MASFGNNQVTSTWHRRGPFDTPHGIPPFVMRDGGGRTKRDASGVARN
jgi:hypothetical protein